MFKKYILLVLILLLAVFLRFWQLGDVPHGVTNDEAAYIYSAYSIWKTGADVGGHYFPLSVNLESSISPVSVYIISPFVGILGVSPFSGRLPFALFGVGSIFLIFLIAKKIFNSYSVGLIGALILSVSPWHLQITRSAYDGSIALFFYLLGIHVFLTKIKTGNINWSLPAFFLAFYSYHATKVFFIFLIPILFLIYKDELLARKKELFFFIVGSLAILLTFIYVMFSQKVTRQEIFFWNDSEKASKTVNWERERNTAPNILRTLLSNKPLYYLRLIRENYLEAFSPQFLFLYGDNTSVYSLHFRGVLYIIELPTLLLGIYFLFQSKDIRLKFFILAIFSIAALPAALTIDRNYVVRGIMMLPLLSMLSAYGIDRIFLKLKMYKRAIKLLYLGSFIVLCTFLVTSYLYQYYFRYSVYGSEAWFGSTREVINYISEKKNHFDNIYIVRSGEMFILQYGLFNKTNPNNIQGAWKSPWPKKIDNISLMQDCEESENGKSDFKKMEKKSIYIVPDECFKRVTPSLTINDAGEPQRVIWKIYENI